MASEGSDHECDFDSESGAYGVAIDTCYGEVGSLWVSNGEYASRVNFCPWCGFEAEEKVIDGDE